MNTKNPEIYETCEIEETFGREKDHRIMHELILECSENKKDIREIALTDLNFSGCDHVMDIGCGFGFFTFALKNRIPPNADITGIDLCGDNRRSFLSVCHDLNSRGTFIEDKIERLHDFPTDSFDLILCSFALYFFPQITPDITRILKPEGRFITITHSEESFKELYHLIRHKLRERASDPVGEFYLEKLLRSFSAENGKRLLGPYFKTIDSIAYNNRLLFSRHKRDDCINYIRMKRRIFFKELIENHPSLEEEIYGVLHRSFITRDVFTLTKHDMIFRCTGPR